MDIDTMNGVGSNIKGIIATLPGDRVGSNIKGKDVGVIATLPGDRVGSNIKRKEVGVIAKLVGDIKGGINSSLIKKNVKILESKYEQIKKIWLSLNGLQYTYKQVSKCEIDSIINTNTLLGFNYYKQFISDSNINIIKLQYKNIIFYYVNKNNNFEKDKEIINRLFKETITLHIYSGVNTNDHDVTVVWIPIDRCRNYKYNDITKIKKSTNNFEAFTASGLTYNTKPRITVITRYEEIDKLLFHELIHNFYLDGSIYHKEIKNVILTYEKSKNDDNYSYEYSLYESYTELYASYLNIIFKILTTSDDKSKIYAYILIELIYSYNVISNLILLNQYKTFEDFKKSKSFKGEICFYEYYYLKALMYNNYIFKDNDSLSNTMENYKSIINMKTEDMLLEQMFPLCVKQSNFSYIYFK